MQWEAVAKLMVLCQNLPEVTNTNHKNLTWYSQPSDQHLDMGPPN